MKHKDHRGQVVTVGGMELYLGGAMYHPVMDLSSYDIVIPFLEERNPRLESVLKTVGEGQIRPYPIPDFSGVPDDWGKLLDTTTAQLRMGLRIVAFCMGGHGRTGTFLASLIAVLEPDVEDPIQAARDRYCDHAVETWAQAEAVFALKGAPFPEKYMSLH